MSEYIQMTPFILPLFLAVILGGALWFHDVWQPPEGRAERKKWKHVSDRIAATR